MVVCLRAFAVSPPLHHTGVYKSIAIFATSEKCSTAIHPAVLHFRWFMLYTFPKWKDFSWDIWFGFCDPLR